MKWLRQMMQLALASSLALFAAEEPARQETKKNDAPKPSHKVAFKALSPQELAELTAKRLDGGMSDPFTQFANKFFVSSRLATGTSVGLSTTSRSIGETELQSPFPVFYKPTLTEFLDAIAVQTFSKWSYEKEAQVGVAAEENAKPIDGVVVITFSLEVKRPKLFDVTLADGWKVQDRGNFHMFTPPTAAVGMDVYDMGRYSPEKGEDKDALMKKVRAEVTMEWAKRIEPKAVDADVKPAKVGSFEALHYETMTPANNGGDVHWRHWVLTTDDRCFFIVSTLFPEQEKQLLPDVMKMLESFKTR